MMIVFEASITCACAGALSTVGCHGGDLLALNQDVAFHEVADLGIHADDGAAFQQELLSR